VISDNFVHNRSHFALVTVDCGNTTISAAHVIGGKVIRRLTCSTSDILAASATDRATQLIRFFAPLFHHASHAASTAHTVLPTMAETVDSCEAPLRETPLRATILSSVVPQLTPYLKDALTHFSLPVLRVDPACAPDWDINLGLPDPRELGEDLFADIAAVCLPEPAARPTLIVDCGTAVKFILVTRRTFAGLVIAPGIAASAQSLTRTAAQLPDFTVKRPAHVLGKNTLECMQSGAYYGSLGMISGIIHAITQQSRAQGDRKVRVIATGGDAPLFAHDAHAQKVIDTFDPDLTHVGLAHIADQLLTASSN
jgi:type III pantothenate kinase